jgi:molecular chaperone GrpE (heat shock protein)
MAQRIELETDFAAAMQELSAQADTMSGTRQVAASADFSLLISAVHSLGQRIEALEESVFRKFETLPFASIESQLSALRERDTVNQKLFDSLHEELLSYRDNFVREALQKPFIRDLLVLFDDLSAIAEQTGNGSAAGESQSEPSHSRQNLENMLHFLVEILHRLEVKEIPPEEKVDRSRHRVISVEPAATVEEDWQIVRRLKRGFIWHDRILRPEEVVVKRFQAAPAPLAE